jgi:hypothetical protein
MRDRVGVGVPELDKTKELIRRLVRNTGKDPDVVDPRLLQNLLGHAILKLRLPPTEEELRSFIHEDEDAIKSWAAITF